jgi:hypothetical protein
MLAVVTFLLIGLSSFAVRMRAQGTAETVAIKQIALDYREGWYECNPKRMDDAVHPDLVKRIPNQEGESRCDLHS